MAAHNASGKTGTVLFFTFCLFTGAEDLFLLFYLNLQVSNKGILLDYALLTAISFDTELMFAL